MYFATDKEIFTDDLLSLAIDLHEAFGGGVVHVWRGFNASDGLKSLADALRPTDDARHCITAISEYEQDGPTIKPGPGEYFYEVHLWGRYYGKGYERGDLPSILAVDQWLGLRVPGCRVYYGGDSGGVLAKELTLTYRAELWGHFCKCGHEPYRTNWQCYDIMDSRPVCPLCKIEMRRFGGGNTYAAYECRGCGHSIETHDSGKTWSRHKNK
jgi:hypothetical protein